MAVQMSTRFVRCLLLLIAVPALRSVQCLQLSTGPPDLQSAVLSIPVGFGRPETETADDFKLDQASYITQMTFTGLITDVDSLKLKDVRAIDVELYRLFPFDSPETICKPAPDNANNNCVVPTRKNSPADDAFKSVSFAKGGNDNTLSLTAIAAEKKKITVANTIIDQIRPCTAGSGETPTCVPGKNPPTLGGNGARTGLQVTFSVTFEPPLEVEAGQYFIAPKVGLSHGQFLWLTAAKTGQAGFANAQEDLQSWVRNPEQLGRPDWLRAYTDIENTPGNTRNAGPHNQVFTLTYEALS